MSRYEERIKELEKELSTTKYNKRTQHAIGLLKAKIARLREKAEAQHSSGKKGEGYSVKKSGDATAILIGLPSVGKSTLLNALTNKESEVGAYAFTTLTVVPGLLYYKDAKIQILDVPGIVEGAAQGRGRGKEVLSVMRSADLAIIMLDVFDAENALKILQKEVYDAGLRLNKSPPDIKITKTTKGGIVIHSTVPLKLHKKTISDILREFKITNASVVIRSEINIDDLIDAIEGNKVYIPAITILNKADMVDNETLEKIKSRVKPDLCISASTGYNLDKLKDLIFTRLDLIRIYCKEPGKEPDLEEALIMRSGSTVADVCMKLHRDLYKNFKFARVWGKSAKFPGQKKMLGHVLKDRDIIEIHTY